MADTNEKKVIEIVVKAVGDADVRRLGKELQALRREAQGTRQEVQRTNETLSGFGKTFSTVSKAFAGGLALKNLVQSSTVVKELTQNVRDLSGAFIDAVAESSGLADTIGNPEFWATANQGAKDLGRAIGDITKEIGDWFGEGGSGSSIAANAVMNSLFPGQTAVKAAWEAYKQNVKFDMMPIAEADWAELMGDLDRAVASGMERAVQSDKTNAIIAETLRNQREAAAAARGITATDRSRMRQESLAAAADARANTAQFRNDPSQLMADMDAAARSTSMMQIDIDRVAGDLAEMVEDSSVFRETWQELAETTYSWDDALTNAIADMDRLVELQSDLTTQAVAWGDALTRGIAGVLNRELHNTRDLLRTITEEMRNFYAEMAARAAAKEIFGWIQSGLSSLSGLSASTFTSFGMAEADGDAFAHGNVVPFARGGIVSRPTLFPMARGMGLMGEAGPEAVMPLRRGRDGKLGVAASARPVVVENHGQPVQASVIEDDAETRIVLRAAQLGASIAQDRINRSVRSGYGPTAQSMQASWGLRRRT